MKHTDYRDLWKKVTSLYKKELTAALRAHGGSYSFMHNKDGFLGPKVKGDTCISTVRLDADGNIRVFVTRESTPRTLRTEKEYNFNLLGPATVDFLLHMIPATDDIEDVTVPMEGWIDPEILLELTAATYHVLYPLGLDGISLSQELRLRAEKLTQKYAGTNWEGKDFWLTMDEECDQFLKDMISLYCGAEIEIKQR